MFTDPILSDVYTRHNIIRSEAEFSRSTSRWDKGATNKANNYTCFYGNRSHNHELGTGCFVQKFNRTSS